MEEDVKKIITSDYISLPTEKRREYAKIKMESFNNDPLLHNYFISKEENENLKIFRLLLSYNVAKIIRLGMSLLGIEVPDRM